MAKKSFSIADFVQPDDVSNLDRPVESAKVIEIPIENICCNEKNFYDTSNIDELVKSIELNGLLEPVIVKPDVCSPQFRNGTQFYRLISGHRRFLSFKKLHEDDPEKWATIPAIVREPANEVVEELMLIEANRATRVLSSADTMRQAERYKELLVQLKEQGVEIPGRLRDVVAEAMQISASRLARLEVIRKNLIPEYMEQFQEQTRNETCAYALAQLPAEQQTLLFEASGGKEIYEWKVKEATEALDNIGCMRCKNGDECTNKERIIKHWLAKPYDYMKCAKSKVSCCGECAYKFGCAAVCPYFAAEIKKKKDKEKENKKKIDSEAETVKLNQIAKYNELWLREGFARNEAKVPVERIEKYLSRPYMSAQIENLEYGNIDSLYESPYEVIGFDGYIKLAELYHCSLDYLLCRTDSPNESGGACWQTTLQAKPKKGQRVIADVGFGDLRHVKELIFNGEQFEFPELPGDVYGTHVNRWIPYPADTQESSHE